VATLKEVRVRERGRGQPTGMNNSVVTKCGLPPATLISLLRRDVVYWNPNGRSSMISYSNFFISFLGFEDPTQSLD